MIYPFKKTTSAINRPIPIRLYHTSTASVGAAGGPNAYWVLTIGIWCYRTRHGYRSDL